MVEMNDEFMEKLDQEGEEFSRRQLKETTLEEDVAKALGKQIEEPDFELTLLQDLKPVVFKVIIPP